MTIWSEIGKLAKEMLGVEAPNQTNFASVQSKIQSGNATKIKGHYISEQANEALVEITDEYRFILEALRKGCPAMFVTGSAGTGKSTLINWLSRELPCCAVLAPTALAASNVNGVTIHSFFNLPPRHIEPEEELKLTARSRAAIENIRFLIIDEVSMVLPNIVDAMNAILVRLKKNNSPFGGIQVVFLGDLLQLPPIVSSKEEAVYYTHNYKSQFFFAAKIFNKLDVFPVQLTKTYRQSDQQFVDILTRIRLNRNHKESVAKINRECFRDKVQVLKTDDVTLVPTNASARTINERELGKLNGAAVSIEAIITGNVPLNKWNISVPSVLRLKVGAKVIFMKNKKPFWINGDLGIVTDILDNSIQVRKLASDNIVSVDKEIWEKFNYEYNYSTKTLNHNVVASFEQFPLSLGWAITIHKSQGMTLDEVTIDLGAGAFSPGQTYVALSRARSIEGITLIKPISMTDVHADQTAIKFYQSLGLDGNHYSD